MKKYLTIIATVLCFVLLFGCKSNKEVIQEDNSMVDTSSDFSFPWNNQPVLQDPIEIAFGDYDAMFEVSKKCQNFQFAEGQEVTIDGVVSIMFDMSIGQRKDGQFFGTTLKVSGWTQDDFPPDESRVKVKAKVAQNKDYYFEYFVAEPSDIQIIEE